MGFRRAVIWRKRGVHERARPLYEKALEIWQRVHGPEHPQVANSVSELASLLLSEGEIDRADAQYERALEIHSEALGDEHPRTLVLLQTLADVLERQARLEEAEPFAREAHDTARAVLGPSDYRTLSAGQTLGEIVQKLVLDSYFLPLCLYYHPAEICGACLILANSCFQEEFRMTVLNDGAALGEVELDPQPFATLGLSVTL